MGTYAQIFQTLLAGIRADGVTLAGGKAYFYVPGGGEVLATIYDDRNKTSEAANPYTLSADGNAEIFGDGLYDVKITNASNVQKYFWENVKLQDANINALLLLSSYESLTDAVTTIGSANISIAFDIDSTITADLEIPSTWDIQGINGFTVDPNGFTLTMPIPNAGAFQIFEDNGTVKFSTVVDRPIPPEWWGAYNDGTNATITTNACHAAARAAGVINLGYGTYLLDGFRFYPHKTPADGTTTKIIGLGYKETKIQQAATDNPAIDGTSDANTGQFLGIAIKGITIIGAQNATVPAVTMTAAVPFAITNSDIDFEASDTFSAFVVDSSTEFYNNKVKVVSNISSDTAIVTWGSYNELYLFATGCESSYAITSYDASSIFHKVVADSSIYIGGQHCTVLAPTLELINPTLIENCIDIAGFDNTIINPTVVNADPTKMFGVGIRSLNTNIIINPRILGSVYPDYPLGFDGATTVVGGNIATDNLLEAYIPPDILSQVYLYGDVSSYSNRNNRYGTQPQEISGATYTIDAALGDYGFDKSLYFTNAGGCVVTFPVGDEYIGRELLLHSRVAGPITSASSDILPLTAGATDQILLTVGSWVKLQYDGTYWRIIESSNGFSTGNLTTGDVTGTTKTYKMPIYDEFSGSLLGYIQLYAGP